MKHNPLPRLTFGLAMILLSMFLVDGDTPLAELTAENFVLVLGIPGGFAIMISGILRLFDEIIKL